MNDTYHNKHSNMNFGRLRQETTMWDPYRGKRSRGRPSTRWADYFNKIEGPHCSKVARDRKEWEVLGNTLNAANPSRGLP